MSAGAGIRGTPSVAPLRGPRPVLWHALRAGVDFEGYFRWRRGRDGDPFAVGFPGFGTALFTGTAAGARELFRAPADSVEPPLPNPIEPMVGTGSLILTAGARHRRDRTMLAPAFHGSRIRAWGTVIQDATVAELTGERTGAPWRAGARVDARAAARAITLRVVLAAALGVHDARARDEYTSATTEFLNAYGGPLMLLPALRRGAFGLSPWDRFMAARERLDALIDTELAARPVDAPGADVLGTILAARCADGGRLGAAEVRDQVRTLLVAGHETTATVLVWALYRLHRHPPVLARLRAELAAHAGAEPAELARLPYLDAVCQETLRLHPPVPIVLRRLRTGYTLRGRELAAGDTMGLAVPLLHSDPQVWERPERFRPERFLERRYGPFEFAPFGGGHRRCIGAALADYELRIVLATLLSRVRLRLSPRFDTGRVPISVPHNIATGPRAAITFDVLESDGASGDFDHMEV
ncbi:cytochrome P450 [Nocardia otitidiscaviarum]|uniref:Cytochrome P450 n=1 Tax=Nocardia otitidiscaviarum TaxID=1823 RepID=A0A516NUN2_9NOCA|nr:cytochrome P450 [Nocardia otitidiscaviarum]MCP9622025.1 cytochrome P450 [Nocardia otitidiscaviarum]QDP82616.1 cytochrome P450 [Nocardia otitidiscaviarum]